jgi:CheY-like chemotaxis protein
MGSAMTLETTSDRDRQVRRAVSLVVADNDATILDLVSMDLKLEGYDVLATATSGEAAAELCAQLFPDVLVVDQRMPPGLTGLETIERVRAEGTAGACILYTNYRSAQLKRAALKLDATYVEKGPLRNLRVALRGLSPGE